MNTINKKRIVPISAALFVLILIIFILPGCLVRYISGNFNPEINPMEKSLKPETIRFIEDAFRDIQPDKMVDYHVHIVGMNTAETGCMVNDRMKKWYHVKENIRYKLFLSSFGAKNDENADRVIAERLIKLIRSQKKHGKYVILALDKNYNKDGTVNLEKTEFHTPNEYVFSLYEKNPDIFIPAVSVHPYRKDAIQELEKWGRKGVRIVKWLPNAQGMNPSDPAIDPFYKKMIELNMVLLCHAGEESAVEAEDDQKLGNPLFIRRPLDLGLKVIVAHGASLGKNEDLDSPKREMRDNFDLFLRLMDEKKYEGLLFADISAQLQFNRLSKPLEKILTRPDLHHRLMNGTDYPLPAMNIVIRTGKLESLGFITKKEREYLNEIYKYNPLLFDFVLKRTVRHPKTGVKFPASLFMENRTL